MNDDVRGHGNGRTMTYDVFCSYAHTDDIPPDGATLGWVSSLAHALTVRLSYLVGRQVSVFQDTQLAANENVSSGLYDRLRQSRVLVVVMSAGYQRSSWCQRELGEFVASSKVSDGIFLVETRPVTWTQLPAALQGLKGIRFWHMDEPTQPPRQLGYPVADVKEDSPYWRAVNNLAHYIASKLEECSGETRASRPAVLVAETTDDLVDERQDVISFLHHSDVEVLPGTEYPSDGVGAFAGAFSSDLQRAALFVQLLGKFEGRKMVNGAESRPLIQARLADARAKTSPLRIVQWRTPDALTTAGSYGYVDLVCGPRVLTGTIASLRRGLEAQLALLRQSPESGRANDAAGSPVLARQPPLAPVSGGFVVVKADRPDQELAEQVAEALAHHAFDVAVTSTRPPSKKLEAYRREHDELLSRCDGLVLVYGRAPKPWVQAEYAVARKVLAMRGARVTSALLDGPPGDKEPAGLRSAALLRLDCRDGFTPEHLLPYIDMLRQGATSV